MGELDQKNKGTIDGGREPASADVDAGPTNSPMTLFLSVTKGNVAAANALYRKFQQRRRAQAEAKAGSADSAPAAAGSADGILTPEWAQEPDQKTDDAFATDRATAAPTTVPSSKEPESAAAAPVEAVDSDTGKPAQEEKEAVPSSEGDAGKADAALAQAETTEHVSSAPAATAGESSDSGAGATDSEPKPTQAAELDDLFGALKVDAGNSGNEKAEAAVEQPADHSAEPVAEQADEKSAGDAAAPAAKPAVAADSAPPKSDEKKHSLGHKGAASKAAAGHKLKAIVTANASSLASAPAKPAADARANAGSAAAPPASGSSWDRFVYAIGVKESGNAAPDKDGVVGTDLRNASGVEGSYGRFQTVASSAIDMLEHDPDLRAKYGFSESEVADLKQKTAAVAQYYSALVGRSGSKGEAEQGRAQKALQWNAAEVELAKTDPERFIAKHRDAWTTSTGLGEGDLDRLIGSIEFRRLIREYRSSHAALVGDKNKKARMEAAHKFYDDNKAVFDRIQLGPGDLAAYMNKGKQGSVEGIMAENLAGFQMKAAGGRQGHLSKAINADGAVGFGKKEVEDVRKRVVAQAKRFKVELPKSDDELYMLCARMHNGGLSKEEIENPSLLEHDEYVSKVMAIYRGNVPPAKGGKGAGSAVAQHDNTKIAPGAGPAKEKAPSNVGSAKGPPEHHEKHDVERTIWETVTFWKSDRDIVAERLRERGVELAGRVGKGELKVEDAQKQIEEYDKSLEGEVTDLGQKAAAALAGAQVNKPADVAEEKSKEPAAKEQAAGGSKEAPAGEDVDRKKHVDEMLSAARLKDGDASWGQAGSIKDEKLSHPAFQSGEKKGGYAGNFKCNIFVGEFLYRSGFMTAGSDENHEPTVKYPDVNGMCDDIEAVAKGAKPLHGAQWFDVVQDPEHNAQSGDVVIVRGKFRQDGHGGMHVNSKTGMKEEGHGHIELLSDVIRDEGTGQLREVTAIGAGSEKAHEHQMSKSTTFNHMEKKHFVFNENVWILRPRLR